MIVPTLLSFVWMSTFGGAAIYLQSTGVADVSAAVHNNVATALFAMLESFPLTKVASLVGMVLVTVFFVTSSDSGSLVVDHLTSGGKLDSPVAQRIFWAVTEGVLAAVLLWGNGLHALQTASVATGLPFAMVLLVMVYSLYIGLSNEHYIETAVKTTLQDVHTEHKLGEAIAAHHEEMQATENEDENT